MLSVGLSLNTTLADESVPDIKKLSEDSRWSTLLHYRKSLLGPSVSQIHSQEFFLSPNGATHLNDELTATLKAMGEPAGSEPNRHAQCRFPARATWLKSVMPEVTGAWPKLNCSDYLTFSKNGRIESISLLFASGYLSNPASYFGHPLIKFNLPQSKRSSSLLDLSVNYGAMTPLQENPLVYAVKGLFGGYDATFSHRIFYYNNHNYGEIELRDMWDYQLNLTPSEVAFFYSHIWELVGKKFPYFFLKENCASAVAQLLEDATGIKLMPAFLPYTLPATFFEKLAEAKRTNGEPLVRSFKLIPSRQTRLIANFNSLDSSQKIVVEEIANGKSVSESISTLPVDKRSSALETLFDYFSFRDLEDRSDHENIKFSDVKRELLTERLQLPVNQGPSPFNIETNKPQLGSRPFLIRAGAFKSLKSEWGAELQIRPAYYDFLSTDFGRPKNSEVRVLDTTANILGKDLWLRQLDLIAVSTLNLSQTGLPGDGGWAWRFATGFENLNLACHTCNLFKVEAGFGKGFTVLERQVVFAMIDLRGQTVTSGSGQLAGTPFVGTLIDWFPSGLFKTEVIWGYRSYMERSDANSEIIRIENRLGLSRDWDVRIAYEKHVDEWLRLSLSWYL